MSTTRKRRATIALATLGFLLTGVFSGCSVRSDDEPDPTTASAEPEPTPPETSESVESPTPSSTPAPSPTASAPAKPVTPAQALLTAGELPPLNAATSWADAKTGPPGTRPFGLCQKFDMLSIGAMTAVQRDFTGSDTDRAGQQVAEFPDAQNTVRASKVLESWHRDCRATLGASPKKYRNVKVRELTPVSVPFGKGWYYLVSFTRRGEGYFSEFGVAFSGARMTMLTMEHAGMDHIYEPGQDPMQLAVMAASAKMGP